jgi:hypothetical protein
VNTEPLPNSLFTVTSPPIMRASLRERAKAEPRAAECDFDLTTRLHGSLSQVRLAVLGRLTTRLFHSIKVH